MSVNRPYAVNNTLRTALAPLALSCFCGEAKDAHHHPFCHNCFYALPYRCRRFLSDPNAYRAAVEWLQDKYPTLGKGINQNVR